MELNVINRRLGLIKVTKLTTENLGAVFTKKTRDQLNRAYALEQAEKKKRRESANQLLERVLRDLQYFLKEATRSAEERSKKSSAAIKAGLARARKRGVKLGGAHRKSAVNPKSVLALKKRGLKQQEIASILGISQPLVSKILRNRRAR
jgi:hypothetical protein